MFGRPRLGRRGRTSQLRYATAAVATTSANTAASETITLPVAAIPRTLRIAANGVALAEILVDNVTKVSVQAQPSGNPQEVSIPDRAFPQPVTSVTVLLTNPATTGGQALIAIGY